MMNFPTNISTLLNLAGKVGTHPMDRLERGTPPAGAREAVAKSSLKPLVQGALYLYFDCFDEAHDIANAHEGSAAGNWIHAILHRREPDASNSKYWYHRVKLPVKVSQGIAKEVLSMGQKDWDPIVFVDLCEQARKKSAEDPLYRTLVKVQEVEWRGLLNFILNEE